MIVIGCSTQKSREGVVRLNTKYQCETKNLQRTKQNFDFFDGLYKRAISEENKIAKNSLLPSLYMIESMIIENFLYQLLNDDRIDSGIVQRVRQRRSLVDKWKELVAGCVSIHYGGNAVNDLSESLKCKYEELNSNVDEYIGKLVQVRNRFAHGQHIYAFNNKRTALNADTTDVINSLTYFEIRRVHEIFKYIMSDLLLYVVVSDASFRNKFDAYHSILTKIKNRFSEEKYDEYESMIVSRYKKGKEYRQNNYE